MNMCLVLDALEAERARQARSDMPSVYMEGDSDSDSDSSDSDEGAVHPITLCLLCKADKLSGHEHWFERMCLRCRSAYLSQPQREQQRLRFVLYDLARQQKMSKTEDADPRTGSAAAHAAQLRNGPPLARSITGYTIPQSLEHHVRLGYDKQWNAAVEADKAARLIQRWWLMWRWKKWLPERRRYRKWLRETFEYLEPDL